ncbi:MAG: inositol monophosphatase [Deltaproteobacteria bacterium]|nr:inositol monophosphatase [Deltaproteobacteria bacterium]
MNLTKNLVSLAKKAGEKLMDLRSRHVLAGSWVGTQYKAEADIIIHNYLKEGLSVIDTEIPVVSEEDPHSLRMIGSDRYFIVDPIDGTASYAQGFSGFVTQVALVERGVAECCAICAPVSGEVFWAEKENGAFMNGSPLTIRDTNRFEILIDNYPQPKGITRSAFMDLELKKYVESGSISLKICRVADCTADIFFKDVPVQQWDLAAPHLVLSESGGFLSDIRGNRIQYLHQQEFSGIVAANSEGNAKRLISWYSNHNNSGDIS